MSKTNQTVTASGTAPRFTKLEEFVARNPELSSRSLGQQLFRTERAIDQVRASIAKKRRAQGSDPTIPLCDRIRPWPKFGQDWR